MMLIYNVLVNIDVYCSLMKEHPWAEHLTSPPKRGVLVDVLSSASVLTWKEHPGHVYSDSIYRPSKK